MRELANLLADPSAAPLLEAPLGELPKPLLQRAARRKLERQARRARTLGDLVRLTVEGRLDADLLPAVLAHVEAARGRQAAEPAELPDDADLTTATAWARAHGLLPLLDADLHDLYVLCDPADVPIRSFEGSSLSLSLVLEIAHRQRWVRAYHEGVVEAMRHVAEVARRARDPELAARRAAPPDDPHVRAAWERVRAFRETLDAPALDLHLQMQIEMRVDTPTLVAWPYWAPEESVGLALVGPVEPFEGSFVEQAILATAVDAALDLFTDPAHPAFEPLRRELATPPWERAFRRVDGALARPTLPESDDKRELGWRVCEAKDGFRCEPVQFRRKKRGTGYVTRGLAVDSVPRALCGDPVDRAVIGLLSPWRIPPQSASHQALSRLVGHPRVMDARGEPLAVRRSRLVVRVELDAQRRPRVSPRIDGEPRDARQLADALKSRWSHDTFVELAQGVVRVVPVDSEALPFLLHALPHLGDLPAEATPALLQRLDALGALVELDLPPALAGEAVTGDPRPLIRLRWDGAALAVDVRLRPLPDAPAQIPGEGHAELRVVRGGRRVRVTRALTSEPSAVHAAIASLPLERGIEQGPFSWVLPQLEGALAVVDAIQERAEAFQVEWQGELLRVGAPLDAGQLHLTVGSGRDWFGLSGGAGEGKDGASLDDMLAALAGGGSYVRVKSGAYARIADTLKEPLGALAVVARARSGLRVAALHTALLEALEGAGARLDAPDTWRALSDRLAEARQLQPALPQGLDATLRAYQLEGFRWLARLAHWAPGAVLADDMGLGKTLQAIALLLHRSAEGPALVVAPTSVVFNWQRELQRFAPSLRVHVYHGGGREELLDEATPGAVLLTSWGVLQRDAEALAARSFATAVFDEAQAIKNPSAQRSLAAFGLGARFTLALTGTPVENHATDLWSLMRAVAPGLLGGLTPFQARFGSAVESGDATARAALAALVRPFVLRRTKREVATDLPERAEITVEVDLSPDERALYDTARMQAVAQLTSDQDGPQKRFRVLAALTRLRQLACHPRLDDPGSAVPSSKLAQLRRMLADAREGGHRALVFSQFVEHLKLVREALEADGLRLRWLDGSTPPDQRRREVDAFQAGDGDVFLLSLKAGGTGLNLTAATYVFHLDPWWNPAAEDQATDRAHRIGQTDPVTVYRLVSRGTIEEAILDLHASKRTLAADLLAGTGSAGTLDVKELMALLSGAPAPPAPSARASLPALPALPPPPEPPPVAPSEEPSFASEPAQAPPARRSAGRRKAARAAPPAAPEAQGMGAGGGDTPRASEASGAEEPRAAGAAGPAAATGPHGASEGDEIDLPALVARCRDQLASDLEAGRLRPQTVRNYGQALRRFADFAADRGALRDVDELTARWRDYLAEASTGTDRVFGRPAFNRLLELVPQA